jgi:inosine-uridine nucleoside N-ribohydrolase
MTASRPTVPILIDTDPGIDDVVALALAARSPELEVAGITTTYGNTTLAAATRNARSVLAILDSRIPIYPGSDRPLERPLVTAPGTHGPTGVGHAPVGAEEPVTPNPIVMLDLLEWAERPVTLVTLGPLTNLAHALAVGPDLVRAKVRRHVGMFGSVHEQGNTNRWADFNAWADPEAADIVLRAGLETVMVGLDATRRMELSAAEIEHFWTSSDPLIAWLAKALRFYETSHTSPQDGLDGCVVHDVLPLGELIDPGLLTLAQLSLAVNLGEGEQRGHTAEDPAGAPTQVALDVDIARMRALLGRVFGEELHRD